MDGEPYEALSGDDLARLQILDDARLQLGSALMTVNGEPSVGRSAIMVLEHHTNQTGESSTTLFGLDQDALVAMASGLLTMAFVAYGNEVGATVLSQVREHLARAAEQAES